MRYEYLLAAVLTAQASIAYAATYNLLEQLPEFLLLTVVSGFCGGILRGFWGYQNHGLKLWPSGVMTAIAGGLVAGLTSPIGNSLIGGMLDGAELVGASRAMFLGGVVGIIGMDVVDIILAFSNQRKRQAEAKDDSAP